MKIFLVTLTIFILSCDFKSKDYRSEYDSIIKREQYISDSIRQKNRERGYGKDKEATPLNDNKRAIKAVESEPKVIEAIVTDANVLYASVYDDGTRRDGYASYLCDVLGDYSTPIKKVKIVKVNSSKSPNADNAYGVLLGECQCK